MCSQHTSFLIQDVIVTFSFIGKIAAKDVACFLVMPSSSPTYMDCQFPEGGRVYHTRANLMQPFKGKKTS